MQSLKDRIKANEDQEDASSKDVVPRTCLKNELRMVLVGKTGVGKSETGNTIAGADVFISNASASSVTRTCKQKTFQRDGQNLQLIDVPGFVDTNMTPEEIKEEVVKCVALSHPGLHAILFVVEIGRFTNDDNNTIEQFCSCFGKEALEFVIVIFTKVDSLKRKGNTLQGFIDGAPGPLKELLAKTNYRYLGVNNWSDDKREKESFVKQLLNMVRSLVKANDDRCFTNEMYRLAGQRLRENLEKKKKRLAEVERKKDENILREAMEKYQRELEKKEREKMEMEKEMKARQEELERKAEIERKRDEEKLKRQREEYRQKIEKEKNERIAMEKEMKAHSDFVKPLARELVQAELNRDALAGKPLIEEPVQTEHFRDLVPRTCLKNELRMVLVGKTGVGKSETGNTIAGADVFISNASASSVTKTCKQHSFERDGQNLQLIDVPGFVDTNMTPEEIKEEVVKCVALSHPGLHAILFVVEIGRFTNDDINTIEEFCSCFGKEALEFVIVIFTKVDSLMRKGNTLQGFIDGAPGPLKELLAKTNYRNLGVNNWSDDKAEKELFLKDLLHMVRLLVKANDDKCFTNEMYRLAEQKLRENLEKEKKRLAEVERKREELILREANEEFLRELEKKEREKMEMEKEMKARQDEVERKAEMERKRDTEKLKQERQKYQQKIEKEKNNRLAIKREMKVREKELERIAEEKRIKAEKEHIQKLEKEKNDREAIARQMKAHKEKKEQLEREKRDQEEKMRLEKEEEVRKLKKQERENQEMEEKMKARENAIEEKRIKMEKEKREKEKEKEEAELKLQQEMERKLKLRAKQIKDKLEEEREEKAVQNTRKKIESFGIGDLIKYVGEKVVECASTVVGGLKKAGSWLLNKLF